MCINYKWFIILTYINGQRGRKWSLRVVLAGRREDLGDQWANQGDGEAVVTGGLQYLLATPLEAHHLQNNLIRWPDCNVGSMDWGTSTIGCIDIEINAKIHRYKALGTKDLLITNLMGTLEMLEVPVPSPDSTGVSFT
jgi:hypothetical protein